MSSSSPRTTAGAWRRLESVISTSFTSSRPRWAFSRAMRLITSANSRAVVGSPSPLKAMSLRRRCAGAAVSKGGTW